MEKLFIQLWGIYGIGVGLYLIRKREVSYGWRGRAPSGRVKGAPAIIVGVLVATLGLYILFRPDIFASNR